MVTFPLMPRRRVEMSNSDSEIDLPSSHDDSVSICEGCGCRFPGIADQALCGSCTAKFFADVSEVSDEDLVFEPERRRKKKAGST